MSLVPPPVLPILAGENLTDKGCLPLSNIEVDPGNGWIALNFISTASLQELSGKLSHSSLLQNQSADPEASFDR